jgi:hypothetical protein
MIFSENRYPLFGIMRGGGGWLTQHLEANKDAPTPVLWVRVGIQNQMPSPIEVENQLFAIMR